MKKFARILSVFILTASAVTMLAAPAPSVDKDGVGIQGYDPVAFFSDGKPVLGKEEFHSAYHDVTYRFASAEHQQMFEKDAAKYEPQFGGYCAYGVAKGHTAPIKIEAFQIVNGRLLIQYNAEVKELFNKDSRANLESADKQWPTLVGREH